MCKKLLHKDLLENTSNIFILNNRLNKSVNCFKIGFLLFIGISLFNSQNLFSQENLKKEADLNHTIDNKYYYSKTTDNALIELRQIVGENKVQLDEILSEISELEKIGKIVLSSKEFEPIKIKVDEFHANQTLKGEEYSNSKKYAEMVYYTYVLITDLINDKK